MGVLVVDTLPLRPSGPVCLTDVRSTLSPESVRVSLEISRLLGSFNVTYLRSPDPKITGGVEGRGYLIRYLHLTGVRRGKSVP